ncbi:YbhB/YbcL family Raf kinase inhibitor-like protein [Emticicia agri]|uniref:YbhB/YbcL family Raf kinase inhibitor-like protein n=1 Tax=Emticicia agri TaxID=2492393 RepID=A0A4Q5M584_9BACT|nr:YbhB/YbcL family Raf kinase inhibitor-like protein [Emticicia agri]RYU97289.1 YbhB/YbcL family Raf kinase inhibitor-like protein [Emticicia agri]
MEANDDSLKEKNFTLKSNNLKGQATAKEFFNSFGCTGQNTSPHLSWSGAPNETESFAVTIYDTVAPSGSGWWHWLIFNIPADVTELEPDAGDVTKTIAPERCVQSINDYSTLGYGGPCPPPGNLHQYIITVFALKTTLDLDKNTNPAVVGFNINANTIAKASMVIYGKR